MAAAAASEVQTQTPLGGGPEYDTWLKNEMKLGDAAVNGIKIVGGLTEIKMWANKENKTFGDLKYDLLKGIGTVTNAVGTEGSRNYIAAKYTPGAPIRISDEAMYA